MSRPRPAGIEAAILADVAQAQRTGSVSYTPGPWVVADGVNADEPVIRAQDVTVAVCCAFDEGEAEANAARIAACLNALDGIDDPAAALAEVRRLLFDALDPSNGSAEVACARALDLLMGECAE